MLDLRLPAPGGPLRSRLPFSHVSDWDSAVSLQRGRVPVFTKSGSPLTLSLCSKGLLLESSSFSGPLTFAGPENETGSTSPTRDKLAGLTLSEREMLWWMLNAAL